MGVAPPMAGAVRLKSSEAVSVEDFLATIGVATHFDFADTPYVQRYKEVRAKLLALGIRHVRDSPNSYIQDLADHGVRTTLLAEARPGNPEAFQKMVRELNRGRPRDKLAVDAVEGPNEPDTYWARLGLSFDGKGFPDGVVAFQRRLFNAFKADPETRGLPIIGPALGPAAAPGAPPIPALAPLRHYADWGGFHPYPYGGDPTGPNDPYGGLRSSSRNGTHPSVNLAPEGGVWRGYRSIYGDRPAAATETGYPTDRAHSSEALQARYLPRLYAEYFARGIRRTYVYQLLDGELDPKRDDPEESFGLLRADLSERPAYAAMADFIRLLRGERTGCDATERASPSADFGLDVAAQGSDFFPDVTRLHHLFLRRGDGRHLLLLWHEVSGEDASVTPRRSLHIAALSVSVHPSRPIRAAVQYVGAPGRPEPAKSITMSEPARFSVPDAMTILEICH